MPQLAIVCIMTWSVDNIITEIKDVGELLHFKKQNDAKNMEQIESTLLRNVTYKLDTMCLPQQMPCRFKRLCMMIQI